MTARLNYKELIPPHVYKDPIPTDGDVDCWVPIGSLTCAHEHETITFRTQEEYVEHARTVHPYTCLAPQCRDEKRPFQSNGKSTIKLHSHAMHRRGTEPQPRSSCYFGDCESTFSRNSNRVRHLWDFHRDGIDAEWNLVNGPNAAVLSETQSDGKKRKIDTASAAYGEESILSDDEETMHGTVGVLNKKQKQNVLDPFLTNDNTVSANSVSTSSVKTPISAPPVAEQQRSVGATIQSTKVYTGHPDLHPDSMCSDPEFQQEVQEVLQLKKELRDLDMSIANRKIRIEQRRKRIAEMEAELARLCVEVMMPVLLQTE